MPKLLQQLHEGFSNAALDPFVTSEFFNRLKVLHTEISLQYEQQASATAPLSEAAPTAQTEQYAASENAALTTEQQDTRINMLQVSQEVRLPQADTEHPEESAHELELTDDDPALVTVDSLHTGHWIEFIQDDEHKLRCKLAAISKTTGRYIFVNRSGMKVLEKTRLELAARFKNKTAILLDDALLFDRALESVIGNLRRIKNN